MAKRKPIGIVVNFQKESVFQSMFDKCGFKWEVFHRYTKEEATLYQVEIDNENEKIRLKIACDIVNAAYEKVIEDGYPVKIFMDIYKTSFFEKELKSENLEYHIYKDMEDYGVSAITINTENHDLIDLIAKKIYQKIGAHYSAEVH